jgi:hypothetical protein
MDGDIIVTMSREIDLGKQGRSMFRILPYREVIADAFPEIQFDSLWFAKSRALPLSSCALSCSRLLFRSIIKGSLENNKRSTPIFDRFGHIQGT